MANVNQWCSSAVDAAQPLSQAHIERQHFVDNLLTAAEDGATAVVLMLRADFYHRCTDFDNLR